MRQDKSIEGKLVIRGFVTQTIDKDKSKQRGHTIWGGKKEKVMDAEELREYVKSNPDIDISGFGVLYSFHGHVNGKPIYFDSSRAAKVNTLGYSVANVINGNSAYFIVAFNCEDSFRTAYDYGEVDKYPDIVCAFKISDVEEGAEVKYRNWRDTDTKFFGNNKPALTIRLEPGHLAKAAELLLPSDYKNRFSVKKKAGREANPDKIEKLPAAFIKATIHDWAVNRNSQLGGFNWINKDDADRIYVFERERYETRAKFRVKLQTNHITIDYVGVDKDSGKKIWKNYREWLPEKDINQDALRKEVMEGISKLVLAFK